jgi:hypothetical protein
LAVISLVRLIPATLSQWEDPLFVLVTQIDAPWSVTLGFDVQDVVPVVYCALSKLLIKATHHHFLDVVYRIPSLLAAIAIMPLGFAVFSRIGGRLCGTLFWLCAVLLPTFTRHSVNARAYMVMMFIMIWALGLTPGLSTRFRPIRLGIAYFLTVISHGFGIFVIGCFALFGCFTGPIKHKRHVAIVNALLTIPGIVFYIPGYKNLLLNHRDHIHPLSEGLLESWRFIPRWIDYQFGVSYTPLAAWIFCALIVIGLIITFRESWKSGISLTAFILCLPVFFGLTRDNYTLDRYSMICLPFALLALCRGGVWIAGLFSKFRFAQTWVIAGLSVLLLSLAPRLLDYVKYPEQDYCSMYQTIVRDYPGQKTVFGLTWSYQGGLSYYARQFGLEYRVIANRQGITDSAWTSSPLRFIVVVDANNINLEMRRWLADNAVFVKTFVGNALPTFLYKVDKNQ